MAQNMGEKIRMVRKDAGLTQTQLAERMGVTKQTVHLYERGEINPKIDTVVKFAEALRVPVEYLVGTESDYSHHWVSVKERLPELDEDEYFVQCLVNIVSWDDRCGSWDEGLFSYEREYVRPAMYDPEQKIFKIGIFEAESTEINALLDPTDFSDASGTRVTHWMPMPKPFGVLKKEESE